jgi:hypothetical protein
MLRQVQDDTESELVAVKKKFQMMSTEFDPKLGQQAKDTSLIEDELTGKFVENRAGNKADNSYQKKLILLRIILLKMKKSF